MAESKWSGTGTSGTGIIPPSSATDNAVVRWNGTDGTTVQDSVVLISDAGIITGGIQLSLRDDSSLPGAGDNMVLLENRNDTPASHAHLEFRKARASNANLANGDEVGGINFHGRHNSSTATLIDIIGIYTGNGTTRTGDLSIKLSSAGAPAERVRITGAGSVQISGLTASMALATDSNKGLVSSATTATQLGYLSGATGTTGTTSTNLVYSASPTFTGTVTTAALTAAGNCIFGSASAATTVPQFLSNGETQLKIISAGTDNRAYLRMTSTGTGTARIFTPNTTGLEFTGSADTALGGYTNAGAWTLGPANLNGSHTVNGNRIVLKSTNTTTSAILELQPNGSSNGFVGVNGVAANIITSSADRALCLAASGGVAFSGDSGTTLHGSMSTAGAWTLGSTASGSTYFQTNTTGTFFFNGPSTTSYSQLQFAHNGTAKSYIGSQGTTDATMIVGFTNDYGLAIVGENGIAFSGLTGASSAVHGYCSTAGAWTFGVDATNQTHLLNGTLTARAYASGASARHLFQNRNAANNAGGSVFLKADSYSSDAGVIFAPSGTEQWTIYSNASNAPVNGLVFSSATEKVGQVTQAGAWTLGSTTTVGGHAIYGTSTTDRILYLTNFDTTTNSDDNACLLIGKGSTTNTSSQVFIQFAVNGASTGSGQINANGASTAAFGSFSDVRLKENITNLPSQLANILALRPVEFDYKDGSGHQIGYIAQEMEQIYPDVINYVGDVEVMKTITGWDKTSARLVKAIQELSAKNDALEARLAVLES